LFELGLEIKIKKIIVIIIIVIIRIKMDTIIIEIIINPEIMVIISIMKTQSKLKKSIQKTKL